MKMRTRGTRARATHSQFKYKDKSQLPGMYHILCLHMLRFVYAYIQAGLNALPCSSRAEMHTNEN